jgi:hypothetical protein
VRSRLANAPLPALGLFMAVLFGGLTLLAGVTVQGERFSLFTVVGHLIGGILFGAVMSVYLLFQRRRSGGTSLMLEVRRSLKTGNLPEGADPETWGPSLERLRRQSRMFRWVGPVEFCIFALLGVYLVVSDNSHTLLWIIYTLLFLAAAVWVPISSQRTLNRATALQAKLERRS